MDASPLVHKEIFEKLLQAYKPSQVILDAFRAAHIGVIAGPTGSGKDTVRERLVNDFPETYSILLSDTTRPPRPGEEDGVHYWFKSEDEVMAGLQNGDYLQGMIVHGQQVSAISGKSLPQSGTDEIALTILVVETEKEMAKLHSDLRTVFLIQPSYDAMTERINATRSLSGQEMDRRLASAKRELETALNTDRYYCVTTIQPDTTIDYVDAYFRNGVRDESVDRAARANIMAILHELNNR